MPKARAGTFCITDERETHYGQFPKYLMHGFLSHPELAVYCALECFRNLKTGQLNPGHEALAAEAGVSLGRISSYIRALERKNVLRVERHHREANKYRFTDPPQFLDHPRGSLAPSDGGPVAPSDGGSNYLNLNKTERTKLNEEARAKHAPKNNTSTKASKRPDTEIWEMVGQHDVPGKKMRNPEGWCLAYRQCNDGCETPDGLGRIYDVLAEQVRLNRKPMVEKMLTQYWSWRADRDIKGGDIWDFKKKAAMLLGMVLESEHEARKREEGR